MNIYEGCCQKRFETLFILKPGEQHGREERIHQAAEPGLQGKKASLGSNTSGRSRSTRQQSHASRDRAVLATAGNGLQTDYPKPLKTTTLLSSWFGLRFIGPWFS